MPHRKQKRKANRRTSTRTASGRAAPTRTASGRAAPQRRANSARRGARRRVIGNVTRRNIRRRRSSNR